LGTLIPGQQLDDLLAHARQVGAQLHEHLGGDAIALADQPEEDVLGADVVVTELQRLAKRQLEDLLGPRREGNVSRRRGPALADDFLDLVTDGLQRDPERLESLGGDAFTFVDQPEQNVLGADVVVVQEPGFLLSEHHDPAGPIGEPFEQGEPPLSACEMPREWALRAGGESLSGRLCERCPGAVTGQYGHAGRSGSLARPVSLA